MHSNHIKEAVSIINSIINTSDISFETNEARSLGTNLLIHLTIHFKYAPTTAAAMVQHLADHGFKLSKLKGDAYRNFMNDFGPRISRFSEAEINTLRKISKRLMAN